MKKVERYEFPGAHELKEVVPVKRRTKVGFGIGLVLVGLFFVLNGVGAFFSSSLFGEYNLTDPLPIEVSSRAVVTDDLELPTYLYVYPALSLSASDDLRVEGVVTGPRPSSWVSLPPMR